MRTWTDPALTTDAMLINWSGLTPVVRRAVVDALISRIDRAGRLLDAIASDNVRAADLAADQRQLLTNHPNTGIRNRAVRLLEAANSKRDDVIASYRPALDADADPMRGKPLFLKHCAVCHRVGNQGPQVGPDIVSVKNKSPEDLLIAILDPNREAQPNFHSYSIITTDGVVVTGMIVSENAATITLRRAEGKESTVPRSEIDEITATGMSVMPEGLEKEIPPRSLADIIAFVKSIK